MSGCAQYSVVATSTFLRSLRQLLESHYSVDARAREAFEDLVATQWESLGRRPRKIVGASPEPWPPGSKTSKLGYDFYKLRFIMPSLEGSARHGRFMYVVQEATCSVRALWIYTHEEFSARPTAKDLRDELRKCVELSVHELLENPLTLNLPGKKVALSVKLSHEPPGKED